MLLIAVLKRLSKYQKFLFCIPINFQNFDVFMAKYVIQLTK